VGEDTTDLLYIRLYIDEHVWLKLAAQLRERGFDVVNVYEEGRDGLSDEEQWEYAATQGRTLLTFDKDGGRFVEIAADYFYANRPFCGLVISAQLPRGELLRRTLNLMNSVSADEMKNVVRFLEDFK
jgi:predicted nuclease of predicted toxin-antitoxin system